MDEQILLSVSEIVTHKSCPDGIGSAAICVAAYKSAGLESPPVNFVQYGTKAHDNLKPSPRQLFVDITPPKGRWEEWKDCLR